MNPLMLGMFGLRLLKGGQLDGVLGDQAGPLKGILGGVSESPRTLVISALQILAEQAPAKDPKKQELYTASLVQVLSGLATLHQLLESKEE